MECETQHVPVRIDLEQIDLGETGLDATLSLPRQPVGIVLLADGDGNRWDGPMCRHVMQALHGAGMATLLCELLSAQEAQDELCRRALGFDIERLGRRLLVALDWASRRRELGDLAIGLLAGGTAAAAALNAAAWRPERVAAVVTCGGRLDLADGLPHVRAPVLPIVAGRDRGTLILNEAGAARLTARYRLEIVAEAGERFEEPGVLDRVTELACDWFEEHMRRAPA